MINKIWKKITSMSKGKKIYAGFWLVTGIFLIAFIAVVSVFASIIGGKTYDLKNKDGSSASYSYEIHANPGSLTPDAQDIILGSITLKDGQTAIPGVTNLKDALEARVGATLGGEVVTTDPWQVYDLTKATANNFGTNNYYYTWGKDDKEFRHGEWTSISASPKAAKAQNSIAAVGVLFALSLIGAVGTTVGVSVIEARKKKGGKK